MLLFYRDNRLKIRLLKYPILACFLALPIFIGCKKTTDITPQKKDIIDVVFANGYISKSNEYTVTANADGFLTQSFLTEGDSVYIGLPLFTISNEVQNAQLDNARINYEDAKLKASENSPQIAQLKVQLKQAKTQLSLDSANFERYSNLIKTNAVSQVDYDKAKLQLTASQSNVDILENTLKDLEQSLTINLKNSRNQLKIQQENQSDYTITPALNGRILNIYKERGELIRRGEVIAKIGGGKNVLKLYVAEEDINKIKIGQTLKVSLNTYKDQLFDAKLSKIYPAFDAVEQSFIIEAHFINEPKTLFSGTQLQANIIINHKKNALVLPSEYIVAGDSILVEDKTLPVKIGIRNKKWVEIITGVDENTQVTLPKN